MLFPVIKAVGSLVVGVGATVIGSGLVKSITPVVASKALNAVLYIGGVFITGAITTAAISEYDKTMDGVEGIVKRTKEKIQKAKLEPVEGEA